jgi:hypothetical protein
VTPVHKLASGRGLVAKMMQRFKVSCPTAAEGSVGGGATGDVRCSLAYVRPRRTMGSTYVLLLAKAIGAGRTAVKWRRPRTDS